MDDTSERLYGIFQLRHSKTGSLCSIHEQGATILNFQPTPDKYCEQLFVSEAAILDGSKAIRGGIPVCFPIFGPPSEPGSDMPQHGFARVNAWKCDHSTEVDNDMEASVEYTLDVDSDEDLKGRGTKGLWAPSKDAPSCSLTYKVCITGTSLTTTLTMKNTGDVAFPVQALFHTYYEVHEKSALDGDRCFVKGLSDYTLKDKVDASNTTNPGTITITKETDQVFSPPPSKQDLDITIGVANPDQSTVSCVAQGMVDGVGVPISCVVWNPHKEKAEAMSDFGTTQYQEMICAEPGMLGNHTLESGKVAVFEQIISVPPS